MPPYKVKNMNKISFKSLYKNRTCQRQTFCRLNLSQILANTVNNLFPDTIETDCVNGIVSINTIGIVLPIKKIVFNSVYKTKYKCICSIYHENLFIIDETFFLEVFRKIDKKERKI